MISLLQMNEVKVFQSDTWYCSQLYQHSHMQHQKQQLRLAESSRGFFLGRWHAKLSWPQATREEFKVSSQRTEFLFQAHGFKVWISKRHWRAAPSTLNPEARGISVSSSHSFTLLNFKWLARKTLVISPKIWTYISPPYWTIAQKSAF